MSRRTWLSMAVLIALGASAPRASNCPPPTSEVSAFMGVWVFTMTNPEGAQETVRISNKNGTVTASVQSGRFPPIDASGILKDGDMLVLTASRFENGKPVRAVISLTLDGETMNMGQMLEFSQTIKRGSGRKQQG